MPVRLAAAVLAADLIQAAFQRAAQAEIVVRDRYDIVGLNRPHKPVRQDDFAIIEPPYPFFLHDESGLVHEAENPDFTLAACADRRGELCPLKPFEGLFQSLVVVAPNGTVCGDGQLAGAEPDALPDLLAPVLHVHQLADAEDQNILVLDGGQAKAGGDDFQPVFAVLVNQMPHVRLGRQGEQGVLHRGGVVLRDNIRDIEDEEVFLGVSIGKQRHAHRLREI